MEIACIENVVGLLSYLHEFYRAENIKLENKLTRFGKHKSNLYFIFLPSKSTVPEPSESISKNSPWIFSQIGNVTAIWTITFNHGVQIIVIECVVQLSENFFQHGRCDVSVAWNRWEEIFSICLNVKACVDIFDGNFIKGRNENKSERLFSVLFPILCLLNNEDLWEGLLLFHKNVPLFMI